MASVEYETFKLGYQISPIILVNGIASSIPGQALPIVALTQGPNFIAGLFNGNGLPSSLDSFFAHWKPLPGTTLINNQVGTYPFANQATAANAVIQQPLNISMLMICPVQQEGGFLNKLATMTILQQTLNTHIAQGGTFTIATPSYVFTNCLLVKMTDVTGAETRQPQYAWQFDFVQPLITTNQLQQVYSSLMNKIANGYQTPTIPTWSGVDQTVGANLSTATGSLTAGASGLIGTQASSASYAVGGTSSGFVGG